MSSSNDKGRPAPRRRPASFRSRLMSWVERVVPWFGVVLLVLVAVYLAFPLYWAVKNIAGSSGATGSQWRNAVLYGAAIVGVILIALVAVRATSPARKWPRDGQVRTFATLGLLLCAVCVPLLVLYAGEMIAALALVVYYVRVRRTLADILPPWCGGTWKPDARSQRRDEDVVKRPPRSWDETSGVGSSRSGEGAGRGGKGGGRARRKQAKTKRRPGR